MVPKLKNQPLYLPKEAESVAKRVARSKEEAVIARIAAKQALVRWYADAYKRAEREFRLLQIESNLKEVSLIPGWQAQKGSRNGYVMLISMNGDQKPVILTLDYEARPSGGLTYRQLHQQVRSALHLEPKVSLRMVAFRPWYRYVTTSCPCPEHRAIPCHDAQCVHLLGTSLLYYCYI